MVSEILSPDSARSESGTPFWRNTIPHKRGSECKDRSDERFNLWEGDAIYRDAMSMNSYDDITIDNLLDVTHTIVSFDGVTYPWEYLARIHEFILSWRPDDDSFLDLGGARWVHRTARIDGSAKIDGPCIIGANTEVRQCGFIRGDAIVGECCVVGNSTELKNVILFDGVQVPHYNYVGDSILGYKSHMGAGAVTSNVKSDKTEVCIHCGESRIPTGYKKMGAILGDYVEVGCNCVLNPGTIVGRNTNIYPLSSVRGIVPANSIYKTAEKIIFKRNR